MWIETERLYIRQLTDADFEFMSLVWTERCPPIISESKEDQNKFLHDLWKTTQDAALLNGVIFLREDDVFCGRINMQKIDQASPEIGIDILRDYRGQGYGPEAAAGFVNWFAETYKVSNIRVCISSSNTCSIRMFEKLDAKFVQEKSMFSEEINRIKGSLSEELAHALEDIKIREYILKPPICRISDISDRRRSPLVSGMEI